MKSVFALVAGLLLSLSAFAVEPGVYVCGSKDLGYTTTYKIGTLSQGALSVTVLEVIHASTDDKGDSSVTTVKGIANQFTNSQGQEILTLGNHYIELTAGRPSCVK